MSGKKIERHGKTAEKVESILWDAVSRGVYPFDGGRADYVRRLLDLAEGGGMLDHTPWVVGPKIQIEQAPEPLPTNEEANAVVALTTSQVGQGAQSVLQEVVPDQARVGVQNLGSELEGEEVDIPPAAAALTEDDLTG